MNFEPRRGQLIGRMVIKRMLTAIVRPDETKATTKFVLVDAIGSGVEETGLKVGDIVLPKTIGNLVLDGGVSFRPIVEEKDVTVVVRDWTSLSEFAVQTENGMQYVPIDDPKAARSMGFIIGDARRAGAAA